VVRALNILQHEKHILSKHPSLSSLTTQFLSLGHVDGFSDPMVDCKETKLRYRADQLYFAAMVEQETKEQLGYVCIQEGNDSDMVAAASKMAKAILKAGDRAGAKLDPFQFIELTEATEEQMTLIPSPATGKPGTLTPPRDFNLMFQTQVGAVSDASSTAYLRPETAQGIFLNFKNVLTTSRQKIPFGIAQVGKAFRNEITPRNFIFRSREFEQMEVEYFIAPGAEVWPQFHEQWILDSWKFLLSTGLQANLLGRDVHSGDKLAHYAVACTDITFRFPFGTQELMGIAARGNYDLTQHSTGSGKST
jgi:glycyl-tRNA synthetase